MQAAGSKVYERINSASGRLSAPERHAVRQNTADSTSGSARRSAGDLRSLFFRAAGIAGKKKARMTARKIAGTSIRTMMISTSAVARLFGRHEALDKIRIELPRKEIRVG